MTELNQAVVLITGAAGGFGRQMACQFHAAGSRLIISDIDERHLISLRSESDLASADILAAITADLSRADDCQRLYDEVLKTDRVPDVIINNAGIGLGGRFDHVPKDRWEQLMEINLIAPMRLCQLFLPHLIERRSGHIVNISSIAGWIGTKGLTSYCAAKYGLRGFSEALAGDLEEFDVHVTTVYPFFSRTPILDSEQFGYEKRRVVPDNIVTDPADVVAAIINGVRCNKKQVFPDRAAKQIHYISRFFPWIIPILNRQMDKKIN